MAAVYSFFGLGSETETSLEIYVKIFTDDNKKYYSKVYNYIIDVSFLKNSFYSFLIDAGDFLQGRFIIMKLSNFINILGIKIYKIGILCFYSKSGNRYIKNIEEQARSMAMT